MRLEYRSHMHSTFYPKSIPLQVTNVYPRRYNYTSPSHLVSRLLARNLHLLALRICTFLGLKTDEVLKHWASAKILRSKPSATGDEELGAGDDEVCKMIVDKFQQLGTGIDVSYAEIAKRAWEVGRSALATKVRQGSVRQNRMPLTLQYSCLTTSVKPLIKCHFY